MPSIIAAQLEIGYDSVPERSRLSEVLVKGKVATGILLGIGAGSSSILAAVLLCAGHDTSLLVVTDALLEEVSLATERDVLHEVEGVA